MRQGAAFRGQPLLLLGVLVGAWIVGRAVFWQAPFPMLGTVLPRIAASQPSIGRATDKSSPRARLPVAVALPWTARFAVQTVSRQTLPAAWQASPAAPLLPQSPALVAPQVAIGHSLMLFAGLAQMQLPAPILALLEAAPPTVTERTSRWSADGWLLERQDSSAPLAAAQPSYGRSQVGAVLRYRLSDASPFRPQAYLRASSALTGPREQELAAGLSARPLPRIPVRVAAEARVTRTSGGTEVRPAAYAVTELPPADLPLGVRAEAYLQAGYAGGRFATGFVDGQARAERQLAALGESEVSAGAGIWGGAQKGAARLDVGPTATVRFRLGDARGQVAADYRFRVAGDAAPANGPALTLSAGF